MESYSHLKSFASFLISGNITLYVGGIAGLLLFKSIATALYNIYLHPLSKYPGPKHAAATGLVFAYITVKGEEVAWTHALHGKYGDVVRTGPDRLSYINAQAWKDIAGHRTGGRSENSKDTRTYAEEFNGEHTIVSTPDLDNHSRLRKIFSHSFSDKALKLQEPLIRGYVTKLIGVISKATTANPDIKLDAVKLYNLTTFDIMGDLTFGESLGMLQTSQYTPWVSAVFKAIKLSALGRLTLEYAWVGRVIRALQPKENMLKFHFEHSAERVDRRMKKGVITGKPDIWKLVMEKSGKDQLTISEMHANASIFMTAGTETTATLLSGLTYLLLKNPDKLQQVVKEVRSLSYEELSLEILPRLPYLNACFEEGLRCYPPTPIGLPREVGKGGNAINGQWVPEKTRVSVAQFAAHHSASNFKNPDSFVPERWLADPEYKDDKRDAMQPFSLGPRNCIGKNLAYHEMRIILATVLWHFDLELCPESEFWIDQKVFVLWDKPELWIRARAVR